MKRNFNRNIMKKIVTLFAIFSISLTLNTNSLFAETPMDSSDTKINNEYKIATKKSFDSLVKSDQDKITFATQICKKDGKRAAGIVNSYSNNLTDFKIALRKVLDCYYAKGNAERSELGIFEKSIDPNASEIIKNYKQAEVERNNSEGLSYQTEKVVISFPYGTSKENIETIVNNEAISYEIIDDGKVEISDDLPEYKKERLEKIKDYKSDIVILADIRLEDTVDRAIKKFKQYNCVTSATHNTYFESDGTITTSSGSATTNDPHFDSINQWHMKTIDIPLAWDKIEREGDNGLWQIWVAVIDCGVQMNHPDLVNILNRDKSVDVTQSNKKLINCADVASATGQYTGNHGTMVTGIIAAEGNNGILGAGVGSVGSIYDNNRLGIIAIKADNTYDADRHITKAYLAAAINYAVEQGVDIINISYSAQWFEYSTGEFSDLQTAIEKAIAANVYVVCSAGNDGTEISRYPAAFKGVIGVGATDPNNLLASYSNQSCEAVDIVAPGGEKDIKEMYSTSPTTLDPLGYSTGNGTSFATPQVTATLAMMRSINYNLTATQMLDRLKSGSTIDVNGRFPSITTFKLLNAGKSVDLMVSPFAP